MLEQSLLGRERITENVKRMSGEDKKEIERSVDDGLDMGEMRKRTGFTRQAVHQFIVKSGLHAIWKQRVEERKQLPYREKQARQDLVAMLHARCDQIEQSASWPERMTAKWYATTSKPSNCDTILELFTAYDLAQKEGLYLSLAEFQDITGMSFMQIGRIFNRVGIEPMHGKSERKYNSEQARQAMKRAHEIPMSQGDLAYFLNIPTATVHVAFARMRKRTMYLPIFRDGGQQSLTYQKASEVYEALDAGFKKSQLTTLLDTSPRIVQKAIELRKRLEPTLITVLQYLHNDTTIATPYYHRTSWKVE